MIFFVASNTPHMEEFLVLMRPFVGFFHLHIGNADALDDNQKTQDSNLRLSNSGDSNERQIVTGVGYTPK